jgi:KDO2-lipid IV(A) lauroyltransferase
MLAFLGYRIADALVRGLPPRAAEALAVGLARLAFGLRLPARRTLERNLRHLLGPVRRECVRGPAREVFEHFALSLVDFLRLARARAGSFEGTVEVRGAEHLDAARASGRGVILLSAHLGSWEWGAAYLASRGARVHVVARPHPSQAVDAFFARRRGRFGVGSIESRPLWTRAAQALRRREWVAVMGDRATPGARHSPCAWAAALAARTGALVLPAVMVRMRDGRHAACFERPLSPDDCLRGGYRDAIRRYLERYPGQWCAFEPLPEGLA